MIRRPLASFLLLSIFTCLSGAQDATPQRVVVDQKIFAAGLVTKVAPIYPPLARQARIQGAVVLKVQISKSGDVENIQFVSGHPMLAPAAIGAVKQWKYKPYLLNGDPVKVETTVTVTFTLSGKPAAEEVAGDAAGGVPPGLASSTPGDAGHPTPRRVRVSQGVMQGLLVGIVHPEYPADARAQRIQGIVVLKVLIDKEGNVANVQLITGDPALAPAAIEAVQQWKYKPYLLNGDPIEVDTQVTVNFTLAE